MVSRGRRATGTDTLARGNPLIASESQHAALAALRDVIARQDREIAWLRSEVAAARASVVAMADTRAHAQIEYYKALSQPLPKAAAGKQERVVESAAPEASPYYASLVAEGHIDGPVHDDDEEALFVRERERDLAQEKAQAEGVEP